MPLKLKCPSCNHVLTVPTQRAGSTLRCAVCNKKLRVPQLPASPPTESRSPEGGTSASPRKPTAGTRKDTKHSTTVRKPALERRAAADDSPRKPPADEPDARQQPEPSRGSKTPTQQAEDRQAADSATEKADPAASAEASGRAGVAPKVPQDIERDVAETPPQPQTPVEDVRDENAADASDSTPPPVDEEESSAVDDANSKPDRPVEDLDRGDEESISMRGSDDEAESTAEDLDVSDETAGPTAAETTESSPAAAAASPEDGELDQHEAEVPAGAASSGELSESEQAENEVPVTDDSAALVSKRTDQSKTETAQPVTPPPRPRSDAAEDAGRKRSRPPSLPKPPPLPRAARETPPTKAKIRIEPEEVGGAAAAHEAASSVPGAEAAATAKTPPKPQPSSEKSVEDAPSGSAAALATAEKPAETAVTESAPSETPDASPPDRGYEHELQKRWPVYYLGMAMIAAALFGVIPALFDILEHFQALESAGVSRWAMALMLVCGIQLAYAIYILQLPDWSTVWVASLVTLFFAALYAMLLGFAILAKEESQVIQALGLADKLYGNQATGWCFIMLSISILLAYFGGRISVRWYHAYCLVTGLDIDTE